MGNRGKELEGRAYRLGFEVGLHAHDEWTSWAWKEKRRIFQEARRTGVLKRVELAYEKGKSDGISKKKSLKEAAFKNESKIKVIDKPKLISKPSVTGIIKTVLVPKFLKLFK